ncbi:MAG: hypothetical protein IPJ88_11180 [Myxococcales bacterium]|nr:MAG: hypothetical protein IPJ88_11180 [Myxococcales bacterium]
MHSLWKVALDPLGTNDAATPDTGSSDSDAGNDGGSIGPGKVGDPCGDPSECDSLVCENNLCVAATCFDQVQNGNEGGVDCDGDCAPCPDNNLTRSWQTSSATHPLRLAVPKTVYHETRQTIMVYGGVDQNDNIRDALWEYDGNSWTNLCDPCGVGTYTDATMTYDRTRDVLEVFINDGGTGRIWEWDGNSWQLATPNGNAPSFRASVYMAYDPIRQRTVVFGGWNGFDTLYDEVFEYDGSAWYGPFTPATRPSARWDDSNSMVFMPIAMPNPDLRNKMVVYGGTFSLSYVPGPGEALDDMWAWNGSSWMQICTNCTGTPRGFAHFVYDPATGRIVLSNGWDGYEIAGTWEYEYPIGFSISNALFPDARDSGGIAYDALRNVIVQYGGNGDPCLGSGAGNGQWNCGETFEFTLP